MTENETLPPKKARRMLWSILRVVIIAYVCLSLLMCAVQSRLVYFPLDRIDTTPDMVGLPYEEVVFEASDGVRLTGWFVPAEEPRGVVLFCHGNAGNISHRLDTIQMHRGLALSSFVFDYRGYGASEGKPSEQGTYRDAEAAWRYLTETRHVATARRVDGSRGRRDEGKKGGGARAPVFFPGPSTPRPLDPPPPRPLAPHLGNLRRPAPPEEPPR